MSNSPLVSYTKLSPNHSGQRTRKIDRITPHCVVGQCSVERLGDIFLPASREASCNYGIGADGRVGSSRIIRSDSSHPSASQIRSRCSRFTLSAISWYRSLIVEGRMPVALARSACDHLRSPSRVDSKILIIAMLLYGRF